MNLKRIRWKELLLITLIMEMLSNLRHPDNDNIEKKPRCFFSILSLRNYCYLKDTSGNRTLNDKIVNAVQEILKKQLAEANG